MSRLDPRRFLAALLASTLAIACSKPAPSEAPLRVAAASDLSAAFTEVGAAFEKKTGTRPIFSFGSTGLLATQLEQGGPFDVFAAANVSFVDKVVRAGACDGKTQALYARGRLVVWTSGTSGVAPPKSLADLGGERFRKVAIANPEHAPYGKAAKQALERAGVLASVSPKLVFGENVTQALQFARSGNAEAAIVALSLTMPTTEGHVLAVDDALHEPIDQALVVCRNGKSPALGRSFAEYVNGPEGRAIMNRYGFLRPGEAFTRAP
jgi:molybdate transport system substrate-binding protein